METKQLVELVQGNMVFLASIANGMEELIGRGSPSVTFRAGRNVGLQRKIKNKEPGDLLKAIELVQEEITGVGMNWNIEAYKKQSEAAYITEDEDKQLVKLVFRNCLVRSCQFIYGHPQKTSLCMLNHGVFCGLLQQVYGAFSDYEPTHSGENACIGLLKVRKRK